MYTIYNHKDKEKHTCTTVEEANNYLDKIEHNQYSISTRHAHGEQYEIPYTIRFNDDRNNKL